MAAERDSKMTITAKYPGKCSKCGQAIQVGSQIEWEKGKGARHSHCPTVQAPVNDPNVIKISQGQGYGGREFKPGEVIRASWWGENRERKEGILTVLSASKRYIRDDGMSFGVGDEQGYIFSAICRLATEQEAAPLLDQERKMAEKKAAKIRLEEIEGMIVKIGQQPRPADPQGEILMNTRNIYGGGDWWVIGADFIWYIKNNGMDGDDWRLNNVRTGGAGAIGWMLPVSEYPDLAEEIRKIATHIGA